MIPNIVRVEFRDFWPGFLPHDNFIVRALSQLTTVELGADGQLCIFSDFGEEHASFVGCKIHFTGENSRPKFNAADFAVGFDYLVNDRYLRYPIWAWDRKVEDLLTSSRERHTGAATKFCAFVVGNPGAPVRNKLFRALSEQRFVHSPGALFHNTDPIPVNGDEGKWDAKIRYLRDFRFTLAAENASYPGYTTEKIVDAFLAGSVPIYWGDPLVDHDFNPAAFINFYDHGTVARTVQAVLEADADAAILTRFRSEPPLSEAAWRRTADPQRLAMFFERVLGTLNKPDQARFWRRRATYLRRVRLTGKLWRFVTRKIRLTKND